ncbi:hypothetical protein FHS07_001456 [Microbacterium proteolyticum]|uniref:Uncharacterized protein n=1 Tax=Microbacterium proteolyticum TaxID=1572644 RepID=A0A7W5CHI4_9MICO|nr:hypothetical protein [Microbacterium proteolyticum]MBB3157772.1 hypothetical protein [Microbacterium proteolyticum]
MDDDVELRSLRERVYGTEGAHATPAMIQRLVELEDRVRRPVDGVSAPESKAGARLGRGDGPPGQPGAADPDAPLIEPDPADAGASVPRPVLRGVLVAVGALALVGLGAAIGSTATASMPGATADPAAAIYPELTFPQTIEDAISADVLRDSAIDSGSTRYIATVNDFDIYFAQPEDGIGRCIVTFTATDDRPWSAGCASGTQEGAAVFGVDDRLTVAIGDPDGSQVDGIPIRLSDSVTAYVAR